MSSWILAKSNLKNNLKPIRTYHTTATSIDIPSLYMDFLAAYIYTQKMGEPCAVFDPSNLLTSSLKYNPQIKILKEVPSAITVPNSTYKALIETMKFTDIRKYAAFALEFNTGFHQSIVNVLEKASIKSLFDVGIHITTSVHTLDVYINALKDYQKKSKKNNLTVYVLADSYSTVLEFQKLCDPSWKLISLSKYPPVHGPDVFIQMMAEVQIMASLPALLLDFNYTVDRFIYLLHRTKKFEFFKEVNDLPWYLL